MAGLVNVNVIFTALHTSKSEAKKMALGGVIPEIIYSGIAIFGVDILQKNETIFTWLKFIVVPVLFSMGVIFLLQKPKDFSEDKSKRSSFNKGFFLALLNPQLITFWLGWLIIGVGAGYFDLDSYTFISPKITFMLGTAVGAYATLRFFIYITMRNKDKILGWLKIKVNVLVGMILIALSLVQTIFLVWEAFA